MKPASVTIYTKLMCPYCAGAMELLEKKGVAYEEIKVDGDPDARAAMSARAGGKTTLPQIFLGDTHVGDCTELYALERDGKLDALLEGCGPR